MRVALLGATGFIGTAVLEELLGRGNEVHALARQAGRVAGRGGRLTVVEGDAGDADAVDRTIGGTQAVLSALGTPRRRGRGSDPDFLARSMALVLAAMERHRVQRLVAISGAGITVPGERKPFPHNLISSLVRVLAPSVVEAKQREYEVLRGSGVEWTAVRPTRVVDGPATAQPRVGTSASDLGMRVSRRTLARFMVDQLADHTYIREAPFISD